METINIKQIIFIAGPDNRRRSLFSQEEDKVTLNIVGVLPLDAAKLRSEKISKSSQFFALGIHNRNTLPDDLDNTRLVNLVGDADGSSNSLKMVEKLIDELSLKDVVNKPGDVGKTSRTSLPTLLNTIDKVRVARCESKKIRDLAELIEFVRNSKISYPIIVRLPGFHNSKHMKKIDKEENLEQLKDWCLLCEHLIIMEYIEGLHSDGYYRKARISVIDGHFFPQHFLSSEQWCVGVENRYGLMLKKPRLRRDEQNFLESFENEIFPRYEKSFSEIHKKLKMDIYGIDCFLKEDGEVVVFEANPCMDLLSMWLGPNREYEYKIPHRAAVRDAIITLLSRG